MLRNLFCLILAVRLLGVFWSLLGGVLILLGGVSLLHYLWQVLLIVTAP